MGLFDTIIIEQPIMQTGFHPETGLIETYDAVERLGIDPTDCQTKDLENMMTTFVVKDDRLYRRIPHFVETEEVDKFRTRLFNKTTYVQELTHHTYEDQEFHGDISFVAKKKNEDDWRYMIPCIIRFTEGKVVWLKIDEAEQARRLELRARLDAANKKQ